MESIRKIVKEFADKNEFNLEVSEYRHKNVFAVISENGRESFLQYRKVFGDILTVIYREKFNRLFVSVGTNKVDKSIIRQLSRIYHCREVYLGYDGTSPEWNFEFKMDAPEMLKEFLDDFQKIYQNFLKSDLTDRNKEIAFVFALKRVQSNESEKTIVEFMEKEDWIHFRKHLYEDFHNENLKPVREAIAIIDGKMNECNGFSTILPCEIAKEKLESHACFEYSDELQEVINGRS